MRKLGVDEWIVPLVMSMNSDAQSHVFVSGGYSQEFEVKVGVYKGLVLSPLLFIVMLEALYCEFHIGIPREDRYTDDLVITTDSLDEYVRRSWLGKMLWRGRG